MVCAVVYPQLCGTQSFSNKRREHNSRMQLVIQSATNPSAARCRMLVDPSTAWSLNQADRRKARHGFVRGGLLFWGWVCQAIKDARREVLCPIHFALSEFLEWISPQSEKADADLNGVHPACIAMIDPQPT